MFFKKKKVIVTHNGGYHADDVFACATIALWLEYQKQPYKIIRSREESDIKKADFVVDVGGQYQPDQNLFDHHQNNFSAEDRPNQIPWASFGLVWKTFGFDICKNQKVVDFIEQKVVQPIDALDNGVTFNQTIIEGIHPYTINSIIQTYAPAWNESASIDKAFLQAVNLAKHIIKREVAISIANQEAEQIIETYIKNTTESPEVLIIDKHIMSRNMLVSATTSYPEILIIIYKHSSGNWHITTTRDKIEDFKSRINLPEDWAGISSEELNKKTGIVDGVFCHKQRFLCATQSLTSAKHLARLAIAQSKKLA